MALIVPTLLVVSCLKSSAAVLRCFTEVNVQTIREIMNRMNNLRNRMNEIICINQKIIHICRFYEIVDESDLLDGIVCANVDSAGSGDDVGVRDFLNLYNNFVKKPSVGRFVCVDERFYDDFVDSALDAMGVISKSMDSIEILSSDIIVLQKASDLIRSGTTRKAFFEEMKLLGVDLYKYIEE